MGNTGKMIPLTKGQVAWVDEADYDKVSKHKWCAGWTGARWYAVRTVRIGQKKRTVRMHQFIMGIVEGLEIDHRDNDGLNNRRSNLRHATRSQNFHNRQRKQSGTTSSYKGVSFCKREGMWRACIRDGAVGIGSQRRAYRSLGYYDAESDAAMAYNAAATASFGALNVVRGGQ
mgnify:FL=1